MSKHRNIEVYFDDDHVMHICPTNNDGVMALKYWNAEHAEHGDKMLTVDMAIPDKYRKHRDK